MIIREELKEAFLKWHSQLPKMLLEKYGDGDEKSKFSAPPKVRALSGLCSVVGWSVLIWCQNNEANPQGFDNKIWGFAEYASELYFALAHQNGDDKARWWFWVHIGPFIFNTKDKKYRDNIVDPDALIECANKYLLHPWWQNDYLDWIFVDALIGTTAVSFYDIFNRHKFGFSYEMWGGNIWKAQLSNFFMTPIIFLIGWILPGWGFFELSRNSPILAATLAVIYYGWSVYGLFQWLANGISFRLRNRKSFKATLSEKMFAALSAYDQLRGNTIHVPSLRREVEIARDKGISWHPQVLCLLDTIVANHKISWFPHNVVSEVANKTWRLENE